MAAENIRGDTPKQSPPVVENEQFSDIILKQSPNSTRTAGMNP